MTVHRGFDSVYVHLGTPAGTFQSVELLALPSSPVDVVLADADADGDDDLYVLLEGDQVAILLNDGVVGNGTVQLTDFQPVSPGILSALRFSVEDLSGADHLDLVFVGRGTSLFFVAIPDDPAQGGFGVLEGNGDGTFGSVIPVRKMGRGVGLCAPPTSIATECKNSYLGTGAATRRHCS